MDKYDKILSEMLTKFYTDSKEDEQIRRIVKETINAEMNKLEGRPKGIVQEIFAIIDREADFKAKASKQ